MFPQTSMGLIYLIFNQLPFLWDTRVMKIKFNKATLTKAVPNDVRYSKDICNEKPNTSAKERIDKRLPVENLQVVYLFPDADVLHRYLELV